jgi:hypothetical protein
MIGKSKLHAAALNQVTELPPRLIARSGQIGFAMHFHLLAPVRLFRRRMRQHGTEYRDDHITPRRCREFLQQNSRLPQARLQVFPFDCG